MRETILLLGARRLQVSAIQTAKNMGLRVVAIDPSRNAPGLCLADNGYVSDLADKEKCLEIAKREKISGVITLAADYPTPMVAYIAERLQLPGLSTRSAMLSTNKREMRMALSAAGVPCPASVPARSFDEALRALMHIHGRAIFKPSVGQGGRGITCVEPNAPKNHLNFAYKRALNACRSAEVLVEEFVEGPEYSVEALTWNGKTKVVATTEKLTSGHPYYVEIGHNQPPRCSPQDIDLLIETAVSGVSALGIDWSASHSEIRLTPSGPRVMEIGARIGGGYINTHLVPLSTGIDIVAAAIKIALGEQPSLVSTGIKQAAAIRFIDAEPGIVQSIKGIPAVENLNNIRSFEMFVAPGDKIISLMDADGRVGYVISTGTDPDSAIRAAEMAKKMIAVQTLQ